MDEIIQDFLMETLENLEKLDLDLVALEQDHQNKELLGNIFRTIHTIKGTCGFIGLTRLEKVAHHGEDVLGRFRDGALEVTPDAITAILRCIDTIKEIMAKIEETGEEPQGDDSELFTLLDRFLLDEPAATTASEPTTLESTTSVTEVVLDESTTAATPDFPSIQEADTTSLETTSMEDLSKDQEDLNPTLSQAIEAPKTQASPVTSDKSEAKATDKSGDKSGALSAQNIRVNVSLLESLITSVSELVLARNQLLQLARTTENDDFKVPLQRLNHITSELQEGLMQTRMQPVGTAWSQLPRIVRDLAQDLQKEIDLDMLGAETELDRQVIEIIKDPLMHMVRNSADHGLERPQERLAAGKSRKGRIVLKAYHAGGHVVIEISDNGKGLNRTRIIEKIIGNGLATQDQVDAMSDTQIYNYIFAAGFSTAEKVTNVSGRGVGMDVVRSNIEKIGGSVAVTSIPGQGSIFTVKIPLTLAIVSALIIRAGDQKFAIPQVSITELVQASADSDHTVEYLNGHPVLRLRKKLLPLVMLNDVLKLSKTSTQDDDDTQALVEDQYIVVAQVGSGHFGIIVDEVYDTEEIVVKPVSPLLRSANLFAGNTILGDGSVVMILDPKNLSDIAGEMNAASPDTDAAEKNLIDPNERRMRFLVFSAGQGGPKAVPLALIVRLEEINTDDIEISNGVHVLQYRDRLMPLTSIQGYLDYEAGCKKSVLVFQQNQEYLGIIVDQIIDIVEENLDIKMTASQGGSYGSLVINGHTTDLLDVDYFIQQTCPHWHSMLDDETQAGLTSHSKEHDMTICFIDHCELYRNLMTPLLELQNIHSITFKEGPVAQNYLSDHPTTVDAFIIDKDSMGDDMRAFLETQRTAFTSVPTFIIGSHFTADQEVLFRDYGCVACLAKNDRDSIIMTLKDYLDQIRSLAA